MVWRRTRISEKENGGYLRTERRDKERVNVGKLRLSRRGINEGAMGN